MRSIQVDDQTYARLKEIAEPFIDTESSVISRLLDSYMANPAERSPNSDVLCNTLVEQPILFEGALAPNLKYAKLQVLRLDGVEFKNPNWAKLHHEIHKRAFAKIGSARGLVAMSSSRLVLGKKTDEGYVHVPEAGVSIQGVDAIHAWRGASDLARKIGLVIEVKFIWSNKPLAAYPGKQGRLKSDDAASELKALEELLAEWSDPLDSEAYDNL